ncbi:hypothetical protein HJFPF1_03338 [Paramyrothecium foliicola]|nr:hypothetical protein HJFPF1_03338 [Paramyrothecium foliicola]
MVPLLVAIGPAFAPALPSMGKSPYPSRCESSEVLGLIGQCAPVALEATECRDYLILIKT